MTEISGDSDTGASIAGIIASLGVEGYTGDEVRRAVSRLQDHGGVYSTIDENHYANASGHPRTVPRLPAAATAAYGYGGVVEDAIIRLLRDRPVDIMGLCSADIVEGVNHPEAEVREALERLSNDGHVYSTIDEDHFQWAE